MKFIEDTVGVRAVLVCDSWLRFLERIPDMCHQNRSSGSNVLAYTQSGGAKRLRKWKDEGYILTLRKALIFDIKDPDK